MKAAKTAILLTLPALMVGCGGGSGGGSGGNGGGTAPTTYTWQFVSLDSVAKTDVASGCSILSQDSSDNSGATVIAPYIATNSNFNILYHNESGEVTNSFNANSSGQHIINIAQVPDNGYVSLEEAVGLSPGNKDVYMFTVQKDLVTDLLLNVRQHSSSYACYRGEQFTKITTNPSSAVKVDQVSGSTKYYQTSYVDNSTNGHELASKIPVNSPLPAQARVLVTLFDNYNTSQATQLTHYTVMDASTVYDSAISGQFSGTPSDENIVTPSLTATGLSITDDSQIDVSIDNQLYTWQSIYSLPQQYSFIDGGSTIQKWAFNLKANAGSSWEANIIAPVTATGVDIDIPNLSSFLSTTITNTACSGKLCLSASGYDAENYQVQRTHLRSKTNNASRSFYQTIIAPANLEQVFMDSSTESLAPDSSNDKIEVSLAKYSGTNNAAFKQFLAQSINTQEIISGNVSQYHDTNGLVSMPSDDKSRRLALMGEEVQMYKNSINYTP
ncbi:hypothetical protein [Vibrio atypicus]|uniref:hypothetical protein n=1 Tax=Vibrio atypicus TaxID=558271 RepID=UPI001356BC7D|nr:hypothetical protein [Vibrio atypicus]